MRDKIKNNSRTNVRKTALFSGFMLLFLPYLSSSFAQVEPDSIMILVTFSETMDSTIYEKDNYLIVGNGGDTLHALAIGRIENVDSIVVVLAERHSYDSSEYIIYVTGVKDTAGNEIEDKNFAVYGYGFGDVQMTNKVEIK
jgi:hypothetical protein